MAVALAGWVLAIAAAAAALSARLALGSRMEAIARASHELRGPLTAARLGLELGLRCGGLSPARLRAIELELGRAALALGDLAEVRRRGDPRAVLGSGAAEHLDLEGLLTDSIEAWRPAAAARGVELRMTWAGGAASIRGDRLRLAQATGNLIANAIEHGGGSVEVRGRVERSGVRLEVLDEGPGLSAPLDELARRARRRCGRDHSRGHGLAVAGAVAAAHGGRLAAAPSERGARLVLELPVAGEHLGVPTG
ncbi:MAG TPA: HAMP domain-containing sensor histidine kinase [Solirubrobacteraceae bacterium]|nr:HAMP domain-containing sensor histidine kinase [Solirubrobacteraceae bacterium]